MSDLKLKQHEGRRLLMWQQEQRRALAREIEAIKKLLADIRSGRLDESEAPAHRRDVLDRLTMAEARLAQLKGSLIAEARKPRKPKGPTGTRKPLTPAQATKIAQRDEKRRDRLNDLQASRREVIAKKDRQIADVKARLGH
ncbi:MAG: hypothetical protein J0I61_09100 [Bosea sp.]|nr:hypothetical protein [Bosea sp. (in: a-proteobacteria)]